MLDWSEKSILYISAVDPSSPNGPGVNEREFINTLFERFDARCHAVFVAPAKDLPEAALWRYSVVKPVSRQNPLSFLRQQRDLYQCGARLIKEESPDLVISRISPFPAYLFALALTSQVPFVLKTFSDVVFNLRHLGGIRGLVARAGGSLHWWLVKGIARRCIAVDVCTNVLRANLGRRFGWLTGKFFVVENAANTRRFSPNRDGRVKRRLGLEQFSPIVGYIGGLPSERGARHLVRAAPRLLRDHPHIGFLVVGNDSRLHRIKRHVEGRGLGRHFVFAGEVAYERIPAYANVLDVGVAFDDPGKVKVTGSSNQKIRQYLSVGVPVVSGEGGNTFLEKENLGDVVDAADEAAVFHAISKWLRLSEPQRQAFARRARQYAVKNLSVEHALDLRLQEWSRRL